MGTEKAEMLTVTGSILFLLAEFLLIKFLWYIYPVKHVDILVMLLGWCCCIADVSHLLGQEMLWIKVS